MTINRDLELIVVNNGYPLVNIPKTMERSTMIYREINYFDWAMASMSQTVKLPEGNLF